MERESAETIGLQALAWIAGHEELLTVFLGATGASLDDMRSRAEEPEFLGSVLQFILQDDAWVLEFCEATGNRPEAPMRAAAALPGGADRFWT